MEGENPGYKKTHTLKQQETFTQKGATAKIVETTTEPAWTQAIKACKLMPPNL